MVWSPSYQFLAVWTSYLTCLNCFLICKEDNSLTTSRHNYFSFSRIGESSLIITSSLAVNLFTKWSFRSDSKFVLNVWEFTKLSQPCTNVKEKNYRIKLIKELSAILYCPYVIFLFSLAWKQNAIGFVKLYS